MSDDLEVLVDVNSPRPARHRCWAGALYDSCTRRSITRLARHRPGRFTPATTVTGVTRSIGKSPTNAFVDKPRDQ